MRRSVLYIALIAFPFAGNAQDTAAGDVVFHTDARLAVLVRKTHSYVRPTMPETAAKPAETTPRALPPDSYLGPTGLVHHEQRSTYNGKGFRVQVYNGPSREKAMAVKTDLMHKYPGVRVYVAYLAPNFKVKIGDYRFHSDAEGMLREANGTYGPSMIVPDQVSVGSY